PLCCSVFSPCSPSFLFLILRRPPISPLFPYTTLFRSDRCRPRPPRARARSTPRRIARHRARVGLRRRARPRARRRGRPLPRGGRDRKSTRLNSSHVAISYAVFCLKKKKKNKTKQTKRR